MPVVDPTLPVLDLGATSIDITRQICDIESVSGNERVIADAIEAALAGAGHLTITRHEDAIVARTNLGRDKRVVIAGHIDTVPLNNNLPTRYEMIDGIERSDRSALQEELACERGAIQLPERQRGPSHAPV